MNFLDMQLRDVDDVQRVIVGIVAPYNETSFLTPDPNGERIRRGAFTKSIAQRAAKVPLLRNHDRTRRMGQSREFADVPEGLVGTFEVNPGDDGDALLADARDGYLGAMSAGFVPLGRVVRGGDGAREVAEASLVEVSLVAVPAYEGAGVLAVRSAEDLDALLAPFRARPDVNLSPIPPIGYGR